MDMCDYNRLGTGGGFETPLGTMTILRQSEPQFDSVSVSIRPTVLLQVEVTCQGPTKSLFLFFFLFNN